MRITRRAFTAGTLAATTGLVAWRPAHAASDEMRTIPSSGEAVPVIGLGTWITFNVGGDPQLLERSTDVMRAFFDEGGGLIDSSPMYGSAQNTLGHGLSALGRPERLMSADKVWIRGEADGVAQIEQSRANWGVPTFDLLQVHNLVDWRTHLETLLDMKAGGALRYVGVTTSHGRRHGDLEQILAGQPVDFVQLTYNVLDRRVEDRLLPLASERGIGVIVNRPFRQGRLIDRFEGEPLPGIAGELGAQTWAQLLLKFVISHPAVTVAIPATTNTQHVAENKAAARGPLPDEAGRQEIARYCASL